MVRERRDWVDHLVLADFPVLLDTTDGLRPVLDEPVSQQLPSHTVEATVRRHRNSPVASGGQHRAGGLPRRADRFSPPRADLLVAVPRC